MSTEDANSIQFARMMLAVSEGEIEGLVDGLHSVFLDGTPILDSSDNPNFYGVSVAQTLGTNTQGMIPGFSSSESETSVGVKITKSGSPTSHSETISTSGITAVRVKIGIPALKIISETTGTERGTTVQIQIERSSPNYTPAGGSAGDWETVTLDKSGKITGKFGSLFVKGYRIGLPAAGPWSIRVSRLTDDSASPYTINETWWESYTEITDALLRYPNTSLLAVMVNAQSFRSVPQVHCEIKGIKCQIPSNYDPVARTYTGIWDGTFKTAWTDNPAWIFYTLATNSRYGCGDYLTAAGVDKWALYTISQECDEMVDDGKGGTEPRFRCSICIQGREEAIKVLTHLASCFRGMVYEQGGVVVPVQDVYSDPVAIFTTANVVDGRFTYSGSARSARHTAAAVSWIDPGAGYTQAVEYVEDPDAMLRYGFQPTEVTGFGITSQGQAQRLGRWILACEQMETETVSFAAGLDSSVVVPGDLIQIADPLRHASTRMGGRLIPGSTTTSIKLDSSVTIPAGTHYLKIRLSDGSVESRTVSTTGTSDTITVTVPYSEAPAEGSVWIMHPATDPKLYRVVGISETEGGLYQITALQHDSDKYAIADTAVITEPGWSDRKLTSPPGTITLEVSTRVFSNIVTPVLTASWAPLSNAIGYEAFYSVDGLPWVQMTVTAASAEATNFPPGDIKVRVRAVYQNGWSAFTEASTTATDPSDPPDTVAVILSDLSNLTASQVANVPSGGLVATTVQAALNELDGEISALGGDDLAHRSHDEEITGKWSFMAGVTFSSTVTATYFTPSAGTTSAGTLSYSSTYGLRLNAKAGSSYDAAVFATSGGSLAWGVPTGTNSLRTWKPHTEIISGSLGIYHHHDVCGLTINPPTSVYGILILSFPESNYSTMLQGRIQGIDYRSDGLAWELEFSGLHCNYTAGSPNTVLNWIYPSAMLVRGSNIGSVTFLRSENGTTWPKHLGIQTAAPATTAFTYIKAVLTDLLTTHSSAHGYWNQCRFRFAFRCQAGTTAALPACTYNNGTGGIGATLTANANGSINPIDGVTLSANDILFVKDQESGLENGLYTVTAVGDASNPWILTRTTYGDSAAELYYAGAYVVGGTVNANRTWVFTTASTITIGTDAITSVELVTTGVTQPTLRKLAGNTDDVTWTGTHNFSGAKIGGATDYSRFDADGTLTMTGAATVWEDLSAPTVGLHVSGTGVSQNLTEAQTEYTTSATLNDYAVASCQLPHSWKVGSVVYPHIHWMQTTSAVPNFLLQYRWQTNGGAKVTSWTPIKCNTAAITYTSGTMANIAKTASGITPPAGASLSDIIQFRIIRDNANTSTLFAGADPVAATASIISFDLHFERDTLGSRTEYTK